MHLVCTKLVNSRTALPLRGPQGRAKRLQQVDATYRAVCDPVHRRTALSSLALACTATSRAAIHAVSSRRRLIYGVLGKVAPGEEL